MNFGAKVVFIGLWWCGGSCLKVVFLLNNSHCNGKCCFDSISDKENVVNACFLVDSIERSAACEGGGYDYGAFALLGEVVQ